MEVAVEEVIAQAEAWVRGQGTHRPRRLSSFSLQTMVAQAISLECKEIVDL